MGWRRKGKVQTEVSVGSGKAQLSETDVQTWDRKTTPSGAEESRPVS